MIPLLIAWTGGGGIPSTVDIMIVQIYESVQIRGRDHLSDNRFQPSSWYVRTCVIITNWFYYWSHNSR